MRLEAEAALVTERNQLKAEQQIRIQGFNEDEEKKEELEAKVKQMEEEMRIAKEKAAHAQRKEIC